METSTKFYGFEKKVVYFVRKGEWKVLEKCWKIVIYQSDGIQHSRKIKEVLHLKLAKLLEEDKSDDNLVELIDTKVALNLDIEKDELYWE